MTSLSLIPASLAVENDVMCVIVTPTNVEAIVERQATKKGSDGGKSRSIQRVMHLHNKRLTTQIHHNH